MSDVIKRLTKEYTPCHYCGSSIGGTRHKNDTIKTQATEIAELKAVIEAVQKLVMTNRRDARITVLIDELDAILNRTEPSTRMADLDLGSDEDIYGVRPEGYIT
jgi:hypothetical protein